jgi:hypothetical protein
MRYFKRHKIATVLLIALSIYIYINYTSIIETNSKVDTSSEYYINSLYASDARIYNNYLSTYEKLAYDELMDMAEKRESSREIDLSKFDSKSGGDVGSYFLTATDAIINDHPELLQYSGISYIYSNDNLKVNLQFAINNKIEEEINTLKIQRIINKIKIATKDMSDLEKIKYVYEWIGDNNRYDTTFTYASKNQSIYNVFIKGNAVCAGFAKASQVIFQNIGIESITVTGESTGPHMWNIIKYNDKYYYYDSTVSASIRDKNNESYYKGLKQADMNYYTQDHPAWYPKIEKETVLYG